MACVANPWRFNSVACRASNDQIDFDAQFKERLVQPHLQGAATAAAAKDERRLSGHARHFATPGSSSDLAIDHVTWSARGSSYFVAASTIRPSSVSSSLPRSPSPL